MRVGNLNGEIFDVKIFDEGGYTVQETLTSKLTRGYLKMKLLIKYHLKSHTTQICV